MVQPHYHPCSGDCPDGLSVAAIAERVDHAELVDVVYAVKAPRGEFDSSVEVRHRYWSTHCRHGRHEACQLGYTRGLDGRGETVHVAKEPAQCKTCASPCICPCHPTFTEEKSNG